MEENYQPVSNVFYEELEDLAFTGKICELKFWQQGRKAAIHGRISKVNERDEAVFLTMDSGLVIRIDQLIEVNGQLPDRFC